MFENVLTWMIFLPIFGMLGVLIIPSSKPELIKQFSAVVTAIPLAMAVWLFATFDRSQAGFQLVYQTSWIPSFNVEYYVGVDGISITMVLLTALLIFRAINSQFGE